MLQAILKPEIEQLLAQRDFYAIKTMVRELDVHDLAELLEQLSDDDRAMVFRLLPRDMAAGAFGDLEVDMQGKLLEVLSSEKTTKILHDMAPDERTELLEELPGEMSQRLLNTLRGEERRIADALLAYPEESIGRLMTPQYVAVRAGWTVARVFEHIREVGREKETLNVVFMVDDRWKLVGDVSLEDLVLADPGTIVSDIANDSPVSLFARDDEEASVEVFRKYDALVLPVVDGSGTLVGIVTVDDVMDVAEEETTEDIQRMAAIDPLEYSYFSTSFGRMFLKRLPWLVMLLLAQMLTTLTLSYFHNVAMFAVLVVFMPLVNSPAGNTGSQIATLMIRGLAVQEVTMQDWWRVLSRELLRGLVLGLTLAIIGFGAAWFFGSRLSESPDELIQMALAVSIAIAVAVTMANLIGAMLPFFFKRVGLDPAVTSGPFIASTMDILGIVVYFTTAMMLIRSLT
jgi:magnesium transporter